jgi:hypothetical protein
MGLIKRFGWTKMAAIRGLGRNVIAGRLTAEVETAGPQGI